MRSSKWKLACAGLLTVSPISLAGDAPPAANPIPVPTATIPVEPVPVEPSFEYAAEEPRLSLFGLSRVRTVSPLSGLHPTGGIHRHPRGDAKDCDPFRNRCRPCDDKSYLALDRTVIECSPGQNPTNPAKGYIVLGGSPRCNVLVKDPDYRGGTVPQFPAYHPQIREAAKEAEKDPAK